MAQGKRRLSAPARLMAAAVGPAGSTGSFTSPCGTNAEGHHNSDDVIMDPGKVNAAHHIHDYVGNLSTDAFSTAERLAAAGTTCTNGDKSAYLWPVLRNINAKGSTIRSPTMPNSGTSCPRR